jgi:hypothetical protein
MTTPPPSSLWPVMNVDEEGTDRRRWDGVKGKAGEKCWEIVDTVSLAPVWRPRGPPMDQNTPTIVRFAKTSINETRTNGARPAMGNGDSATKDPPSGYPFLVDQIRAAAKRDSIRKVDSNDKTAGFDVDSGGS